MTFDQFSTVTTRPWRNTKRIIIPVKVRILKNSLNAHDCDCRNWSRSKNNNGYATIGIGGRTILAHRVSYRAFKGRIPQGMNILHSCDNRLCVNPDHLRIGTQKDNMRECSDKGRLKIVHGLHFGERHSFSRLTNSQVTQIKQMLASGELTQQAIADRFGVTNSHVSMIGSGKRRARC